MCGQEFGKCQICGKKTCLERTYFCYPIHCQCCGSKDKDGQKQHFVMVAHCKDCIPELPTEIHPQIEDFDGNVRSVEIKNILPSEISGKFKKE